MQLCDLGFFARLGLSGFILVLAAGLLASGAYIREHHAPRDQQPEFSIDDLVGVYTGLDNPSPLLVELESGHPDTLAEEERQTLLAWLTGDQVSGDYDNLDLGDFSPAEILDRNCLDCHARDSADPVARALPLEFWDDVKGVAYSRNVARVPDEILLVTTHTHALSLGTLGLVICALGLATRFPRGLVGVLIAGAGLGLAADLAGWWLARDNVALVGMIIAGGALFALSSGLLLVLAFLDLWLPRRRG